MSRFTVWHSDGRRDGESTHDTLAEAESEFDHQCARPVVSEVEIIDAADPDKPVTIKRFDKTKTAN